MKNSLAIQLFTIAIIMIAQISFFGWLNVYNYAFCFAFITILISIPPQNGLSINLFIAFVIGLIIDHFNFTLGVNAFCCTTLMFIRNPLYGLIKGQNKEEQQNNDYTLIGLGVPYFSILVFFCCLIYSLLFFFLSAPEWVFFKQNILRALGSTFLTTFIILSINVLFLKGNRS